MFDAHDRAVARGARSRRSRALSPARGLTTILGTAALIACGSQAHDRANGTPSNEVGASLPTAPATASSIVATVAPPAAPLSRQETAARQSAGGASYEFSTTATGGANAQLAAHHLAIAIAQGVTGVTGPVAGANGEPWHGTLQWTGIGRSANVTPVPVPAQAARVAGNRASYLREDGSEEWYTSGPLGLEQGFVLSAPPAGSRGDALAIEIAVQGGLTPSLAAGGTEVELADAHGNPVAHYGLLSAYDADGTEARAWLEVDGGHIRLRVDDANARYPLTIDPFVWSFAQEVTASGDLAGDWFGFSVAVSGSIAVVGAPNHTEGGQSGAGAAYVFTLSGTAWTQQGTELAEPSPAANDGFGSSVAIDGTTIVVGAPTRAGGGAAYVFTQSGTTWTEQSPLTGSDTATGDLFGTSVAISGGNALVGAPSHATGAGAAYVFTQSGTVWTQQGADLTAGAPAAGDSFGTSVGISGSVAVVGAPYRTGGAPGTEAGAAYVFSQSGTSWGTGSQIVASDGATFDEFGTSVAISGPNLIVGAPFHTVNGHSEAGAAYAFTQSGASWSQQQPDLTASDASLSALFGTSVAINGSNAVVGAYQADLLTPAVESAGAAYFFTLACPSWTQTTEVTASDAAASNGFGYAVGVGTLAAIVGAPEHDVETAVSAGAAYLYGGADPSPACCIGGTSYASGMVNSASACEVCSPATSTTSWSNEPDGTTCTGTSLCNASYACSAGVCTGSNPVTCSPSDQCHTAGTCDPTTGACSSPAAPDGTACPGGACVAGSCVPEATDAGGSNDGGATDSGTDAGKSTDGGSTDGGKTTDGGSADAGQNDSGIEEDASVGSDGGSENDGSPTVEAGGGESDGALADGAGDGGSSGATEGGGCGCRTAGSVPRGDLRVLSALGVALVFVRRRRKGRAAASAKR